jgi:CrcB protein
MFKNILLIGAGGFVGSAARYLLSRFMELRILTSFPLGTLTVNIVGCFIIGVIYGLTVRNMASPEMRFLLATGFCGGFTTFSSFSYESLALLQDGQLWFAFLYMAGSVLAGLAAVWIGLLIVKTV